MTKQTFDLAIIGAGPGGYVAAIRASQLGLKVLIVEKDKLGGVCGNWGCIPSKSLLHQASMFASMTHFEKMGVKIDRSSFSYSKIHALTRKAATKSSKGVEYLLKKNKVEIISGEAKIAGLNEIHIKTENEIIIRAKNILIATGSYPKEIPSLKFDQKTVLDSTALLSLKELPKSLIILGAGAIGMEFAYAMNSFGVKVSIVEMLNHLLPAEDSSVSTAIEEIFKKQGIEFFTGMRVVDSKKQKNQINLFLESSDQEKASNFEKKSLGAEKILIAIGRTPNSASLGLEDIGIPTENNFIKVNEHYQTIFPEIYAIGDVINSPLLAHLASKEGEHAVEHMTGTLVNTAPILADEVPGVVYTEPGIASFGLTEDEAKQKNLSYIVYSFPYNGIGKANAIEKTQGFVKLLCDNDTHEILGAHVLGHSASEIIHELLIAKKAELLPEDIAGMIHAHPTISEGLMEAARGIEGWALHI